MTFPPASDSGLSGTITVLLRDVRDGRDGADAALLQVVYDDLKRLVQAQLNLSRWNGDMEGTSLANAACERMLARGGLHAEDRQHFFFVLGRAMRDVLVEHIRFEKALRRGGGMTRVPMVEFEVDGVSSRLDLLALHEAIDALGRVDAAAAQVVMLRFFANRTIDESALLMGCSVPAARRHWTYARAWLLEQLAEQSAGPAAESP
ncbi:MAG: ECF-type sigma factor [Phycisphaerae bacterium]|nr:ECF-type sigma factor [Phycisphaerae bacterium]